LILSKSFTETTHERTIDSLIYGDVSFVDTVAKFALNAYVLEFGGAVFERAALVGAVAEFGGACVAGAVVGVVVFEEAGCV
jgi:hypothetical protein